MSIYEVVKSFNLTPESPAFIDVTSTLLLYVIGVESAYECQDSLKALVDFEALDDPNKGSAQKLRLHITSKAYISLNLKFFTLNLIKGRVNSYSLNKYMSMFGICRNDVVLVKSVLKQRGLLSKLRKHNVVKAINKSMIDADAFQEVFDRFSRIQPVVLRLIKSKVYKKLRFICMSDNIEFHDLQMELMCKALQSYIKIVPTEETDDRVSSYLNTSISNHAINIIKSHTSAKRKRMKQGKTDGYGGFTYDVSVLSENQMLKAFGVEGLNYENMQDSEISKEEERCRDSSISYHLILKKYGTTPKKRLLINLVSCSENIKFTKFLIENYKLKPHKDNIDYRNSVGDERYMVAICDYMKVTLDSANNFIKKLVTRSYPEYSGEYYE